MDSDEGQQSGQIFMLPFSFTERAHLVQCQTYMSQASVKETETSLVFQIGMQFKELGADRIVGRSKEAEVRENCG